MALGDPSGCSVSSPGPCERETERDKSRRDPGMLAASFKTERGWDRPLDPGRARLTPPTVDRDRINLCCYKHCLSLFVQKQWKANSQAWSHSF